MSADARSHGLVEWLTGFERVPDTPLTLAFVWVFKLAA